MGFIERLRKNEKESRNHSVSSTRKYPKLIKVTDMKTFIPTLLLLVFFHPLAISAEGPSPKIADSAIFWTLAPSIVSRVNVREFPTRNSPIVDKVRRGTLFTIEPSKSKNNFLFVSYNKSMSQGYIASSLLAPMNSTQKSSITPENLNHLTELMRAEGW